jgi:hypothetical protein
MSGLFVTLFAIGALGAGCSVQKDEGERFREAVPESEDVALKVPGSPGGGAQTKGLRIATNGTASASARYYRFTRDMTSAVDLGTAIILGGVWQIVHSEPTSVDAKRAVWGPGQGNALDPAVWRFTVTEVGDKEYDYVLEGRPKAGGDFLAVLTGHGYGKERPEHRMGWFIADNDAYRRLDPDRAKDYGTTKVTFDARQIPTTIKVELRPGTDRGWADVTVSQEAQGAGSVAIAARGDIDDSKATKMEDVSLLSRWTSAGSGRAEIEMKNGDLPFTVTATECWSDTFARVFYKDTVNYEPASGDASACSLPASK